MSRRISRDSDSEASMWWLSILYSKLRTFRYLRNFFPPVFHHLDPFQVHPNRVPGYVALLLVLGPEAVTFQLLQQRDGKEKHGLLVGYSVIHFYTIIPLFILVGPGLKYRENDRRGLSHVPRSHCRDNLTDVHLDRLIFPSVPLVRGAPRSGIPLAVR